MSDRMQFVACGKPTPDGPCSVWPAGHKGECRHVKGRYFKVPHGWTVVGTHEYPDGERVTMFLTDEGDIQVESFRAAWWETAHVRPVCLREAGSGGGRSCCWDIRPIPRRWRMTTDPHPYDVLVHTSISGVKLHPHRDHPSKHSIDDFCVDVLPMKPDASPVRIPCLSYEHAVSLACALGQAGNVCHVVREERTYLAVTPAVP